MPNIDIKKLNTIKQKIQKASMGYQAQIWDRGMFEISRVKESDVYFIEHQLRLVEEVFGVFTSYTYDYSKPYFGLPGKIYTIRGKFDVPYEFPKEENE